MRVDYIHQTHETILSMQDLLRQVIQIKQEEIARAEAAIAALDLLAGAAQPLTEAEVFAQNFEEGTV